MQPTRWGWGCRWSSRASSVPGTQPTACGRVGKRAAAWTQQGRSTPLTCRATARVQLPDGNPSLTPWARQAGSSDGRMPGCPALVQTHQIILVIHEQCLIFWRTHLQLPVPLRLCSMATCRHSEKKYKVSGCTSLHQSRHTGATTRRTTAWPPAGRTAAAGREAIGLQQSAPTLPHRCHGTARSTDCKLLLSSMPLGGTLRKTNQQCNSKPSPNLLVLQHRGVLAIGQLDRVLAKLAVARDGQVLCSRSWTSHKIAINIKCIWVASGHLRLAVARDGQVLCSRHFWSGPTTKLRLSLRRLALQRMITCEWPIENAELVKMLNSPMK